jgi:hypothetical protein
MDGSEFCTWHQDCDDVVKGKKRGRGRSAGRRSGRSRGVLSASGPSDVAMDEVGEMVNEGGRNLAPALSKLNARTNYSRGGRMLSRSRSGERNGNFLPCPPGHGQKLKIALIKTSGVGEYFRITGQYDCFIAPGGNDLYGIGTITNPWATIEKVILFADHHGYMKIEGPYLEKIRQDFNVILRDFAISNVECEIEKLRIAREQAAAREAFEQRRAADAAAVAAAAAAAAAPAEAAAAPAAGAGGRRGPAPRGTPPGGFNPPPSPRAGSPPRSPPRSPARAAAAAVLGGGDWISRAKLMPNLPPGVLLYKAVNPETKETVIIKGNADGRREVINLNTQAGLSSLNALLGVDLQPNLRSPGERGRALLVQNVAAPVPAFALPETGVPARTALAQAVSPRPVAGRQVARNGGGGGGGGLAGIAQNLFGGVAGQ